MYILLISCFVFFFVAGVEEYLPNTDIPLEFVGDESFFEVNDSEIIVCSEAHTNLFISHNKKFRQVNVPMALFCSDEMFEFSAKVEARMFSKWDAGCLILWVYEDYWAKLCYERSVDGKIEIVSIVNNGSSDNAVSSEVSENGVYLKVITQMGGFRFLYSEDGQSWKVVRYFKLNKRENMRIGVLSQSPAGKGCSALFSDFKYKKL